MAQRRLRDYQDPLGSFEHNLINLGVHYPGRFCGFDTLVATGGMSFKINHTGKGIVTKDGSSIPLGPVGVAMTPQGVIVVEDAELLGLTVDAADADDRYDFLIMNHTYTLLAGGIDATYEILKGGPATVPPIIAPTQAILGMIKIPALSTNSTQFLYFKAKPSDSGDMVDAHLEGVNTFEGLQEFRQSLQTVTNNHDTDMNSLQGALGKRWTFNNGGNSFVLSAFALVDIDLIRIPDASNQNGTEINILTNENLKLKHNTPPSPAEVADLFAPIYIPDNWRDANNSYKPSSNSVKILYTFLKVDGVWWLKNAVAVGENTNPGSGGTNPPGPKVAILTFTLGHGGSFVSFAATLDTSIDGNININQVFADGFADDACGGGAIASAQRLGTPGIQILAGSFGNSASPSSPVTGVWANAIRYRIFNVNINGQPCVNNSVVVIGSYSVTVKIPACA